MRFTVRALFTGDGDYWGFWRENLDAGPEAAGGLRPVKNATFWTWDSSRDSSGFSGMGEIRGIPSAGFLGFLPPRPGFLRDSLGFLWEKLSIVIANLNSEAAVNYI